MASAKAAGDSTKNSTLKTQIKEVTISSSDESDFDEEDDPDSVQVPGGGMDLKTISKISEPSTDSAGSTLILPSKPVITTSILRPPVQPGYEVIRIAPGTSPFGTNIRQNANAMQQVTLVRNTPGGGPIRVNVPYAAVQSMLRHSSPVFYLFIIIFIIYITIIYLYKSNQHNYVSCSGEEVVRSYLQITRLS